MKILHLTLEKKWFSMILSGEKKEEYREIKPYWDKRLIDKQYDLIFFRNGYAKNSPRFTIDYLGLSTGLGSLEWGAPKEAVYILKLGELI